MTVDIVDLSSESEAFQFAGWALEMGLWNGQPISWETASIFHEQVQSRLMDCIDSGESSQALDQFKASLAWIGSSQADRVWLTKEIEVLRFSGKDQIIPAGFWKSTQKFWKKHKKEIIIGAVIVTLAVVISVTAVSCMGAVAVGAASKDNKDAKPSKISSDNSTASQSVFQEQAPSDAPSEQNSPNQVVFSQDGVTVGSEYASYGDILSGDLPAPLALQDTPARSSWLAGMHEIVGRRICDPELSSLEDSFPMPEFSRMIILENGRKSGPRVIGINGINNSYDEAIANMEYSKSFAPNVDHEWVYNNSHGPVVDVAEVLVLNYHGISPNTASLLRESIERFDQDNRDLPYPSNLDRLTG